MTPSYSSTPATKASVAHTELYAYYSAGITLYYASSTSATTSKSIYRNSYFTSDSTIGTVISNSNNGLNDDATGGTVSGYATIVGYATSANTKTPTYTALSQLSSNNVTTIYQPFF